MSRLIELWPCRGSADGRRGYVALVSPRLLDGGCCLHLREASEMDNALNSNQTIPGQRVTTLNGNLGHLTSG